MLTRRLRVKIPGGGATWTLVDEDVVVPPTWCGKPRTLWLQGGYAVFQISAGRSPEGRPRHRSVRLARWILGLEPGDPRQADHINRDRLDNRRANLRVVTHLENMQNQGPRPRYAGRPRTSRHRGVSWHPTCGWHAVVQVNGERIDLGYFSEEAAAAEAAAAVRRERMPFSDEAAAIA